MFLNEDVNRKKTLKVIEYDLRQSLFEHLKIVFNFVVICGFGFSTQIESQPKQFMFCFKIFCSLKN